MGTERDFVVKKGLVVTEDIELGHATDTTIARASAGQITVEGTAVVLAGGANHDGFSDFVANEHIDHSGVSISSGSGLTGGGTIAATRTLTVGAGTGITVNTNDVAITAAQTGITSVLNTSLAIGRDSTDQIKFGTDNQIIFRVGNADGVTFKASGEIEATKFDGALEGNADTATKITSITNSNIVQLTTTQTLTNKTLTSPTLTTPALGTPSALVLTNATALPAAQVAQGTMASGMVLVAPALGTPASGVLTNATGLPASGLTDNSLLEPKLKVTNAGVDNYLLSYDAATTGFTWVESPSGGSVGGSDTELLYNDGGTENGIASLTWTDTAGSEQLLLSDASDTSLFKIIQTGTGDALEVHDEASDTTVFKVDQSGHVQIGTTSETIGALRVKGYQGTSSVSSVSTYRISRLEDGGTGSLEITSSQSDGDMYVGAGSTGADLIFHTRRSSPSTANYENLRFTSNGEIGIEGSNFGTSGQVLTSAGTGAAASWTTVSSGGATALNGLTDVISNTTNFTDSILISPDGAAPPQGGTLSSATNNVGIGKDVFSTAMTSGHSNVAIGTEAGKVITTGHESVYIGHNVGKAITYASDNVAIGAFSLDAASSGGQNVAVGHSTLSSVTGSNSNVAIGYFAGATCSNQGNNVFVGRSAGNSLNSANNVIIGSMAGDGIQTGGNNTLVGYASGGAMSGAADSNICLGHNSGDNISTGDNNVVIGAADVPSATGSDQLSISSGDGGVTWLTGNAAGGINSKAEVVAVAGNTVLTLAQTGSYVYWTSGTCTLPTSATVGSQFTVFNNTGGSATVALGTNNAIVSGWAGNAAVADHEATSYICVAATKWVQVG